MDCARPFEAMSNPYQLDRKMECRGSRGCGSSMNIKSKSKVGIDQGKGAVFENGSTRDKESHPEVLSGTSWHRGEVEKFHKCCPDVPGTFTRNLLAGFQFKLVSNG
uniref:DNA-binding protein-like n=1 Tax=Oryza sativa subsp. indica TaxID=39946 RepID=C8TEY5_ORYSI|nr:DNA-binding protein-like [Oryza sativa Indica Group]